MPACKSNKARKSSLIIIERSAAQSLEPTKSTEPESTEPESGEPASAEPASAEPASTTESNSTQRKPYGRRLDEKDEILLFQLCIQHSLGFRSVKNHKQFWIKISGLFEQTVKRPYS